LAVESGGETSTTLTPDLMAEASRRVGWVGLIYAAGGVFGHFGRRALLISSRSVNLRLDIGDAFAVAGILMGVAVYVVSRRGGLSPKRLLDLGLVLEVAGAFGIASTQFWSGGPQLPDTSLTLIPGECIWIVAYPLVVPNTPTKVLVASLLAASMGPLALGLSSAVAGTAIDSPLEVISYFLPNYLSALVAYVLARIVHRFSLRLNHAREIGSYELVERIGEGGMGDVWRAKHRFLARPAAIKLIRAEVLGSTPQVRETILRRFEREAQDTASLGSVHTIDVYDFGMTEEGEFYYVMELLDGISLGRFVEEFGPMEPARLLYLLQQVCHSLGEAHARGLVHRDIKPANILVCRLGPDDDFVKVLDFGLVKHLEVPTAPMLTIERTAAGTPAFMAPEIALGAADVDGRADIYSLGCVAYYMLTGEALFAGKSAMATALAHVSEQPILPSARSEFQIPRALDAIVLECLAKDPAARPLSAITLGRRLAAIMRENAWTQEKAHEWWELHHVSLTRAEPPAEPITQPLAQAAGARPRCWPRLDRKVDRPQIVSARTTSHVGSRPL
jgi:serine/threonine-protein kinase